MMLVMLDEKVCSVQKTVMPKGVPLQKVFDKTQENDNTLVTDKVTVVQEKHFDILEGFAIEHYQLPEKFQPYCPDDFEAISSHTVDLDLSNDEDPFVKPSNITTPGNLKQT